ncbi:hypothetical protein [Tritonibacter sp. SIMBA_163]
MEDPFWCRAVVGAPDADQVYDILNALAKHVFLFATVRELWRA